MARQAKDDYKPKYVPLEVVPARGKVQLVSFWRERFTAIPEGKAVELRYNNRQRAHKVIGVIRSASS